MSNQEKNEGTKEDVITGLHVHDHVLSEKEVRQQYLKDMEDQKERDQERSVVFAKMIGLEVMKTQYGDPELWCGKDGKLHAANFYFPSHMHLAWRVANWWSHKWWPNAVGKPQPEWYAFDEWWKGRIHWAMPLKELQREMLDKIFSLITKEEELTCP